MSSMGWKISSQLHMKSRVSHCVNTWDDQLHESPANNLMCMPKIELCFYLWKTGGSFLLAHLYQPTLGIRLSHPRRWQVWKLFWKPNIRGQHQQQLSIISASVEEHIKQPSSHRPTVVAISCQLSLPHKHARTSVLLQVLKLKLFPYPCTNLPRVVQQQPFAVPVVFLKRLLYFAQQLPISYFFHNAFDCNADFCTLVASSSWNEAMILLT